jgi:hypothetical protein
MPCLLEPGLVPGPPPEDHRGDNLVRARGVTINCRVHVSSAARSSIGFCVHDADGVGECDGVARGYEPERLIFTTLTLVGHQAAT